MTPTKLQIPKTIRVGSKRYSIEVVETMLRQRIMGTIDYDKQTIKVGRKSNVTGRAYTQAMMSETFWHELTHAVLEDMGSALTDNERFVRAFANRLSDAVDSAKF